MASIVTISLVFIALFLVFLLTISLVSISFRSQNEGRGWEPGSHRKSDRFSLEVILIDRVHRILGIFRVSMIMVGYLVRLFHIDGMMQWNLHHFMLLLLILSVLWSLIEAIRHHHHLGTVLIIGLLHLRLQLSEVQLLILMREVAFVRAIS